MRCLALIAVFSAALYAAVIGANVPAQSLTQARIDTLPKSQRAAWTAYLRNSEKQQATDRAALLAELKAAGLTQPLTPPSGSAARSTPLNKPPEWYRGSEARKIADNILSFQTPAGGWSKNMDFAAHPRQKGEHYAPDNLSRFPTPGDFDAPHDIGWNYVGTLDNDATITQMDFLGKVIASIDAAENKPYRDSFLRGLDYLFAAQFPNGGWPQVWPLQGGYHDATTINDGAMTNALSILQRVAEGKFAFVPEGVRKEADKRVQRGIQCLLAAQIKENGRRAGWAQQHDPFTYAPVGGRNYEPPSQSSSESTGVLLFLMDLPHPDQAVVNAVHSAIAWLQKAAIPNQNYARGPEGGHLVPAQDGKPVWARFYEIGSGRPIFGDRDKTIHDELSEISLERRNGYSWYNRGPQQALDRYAEWARLHPQR